MPNSDELLAIAGSGYHASIRFHPVFHRTCQMGKGERSGGRESTVQNSVRHENCEGGRERDVKMEIVFFKARSVTALGRQAKREGLLRKAGNGGRRAMGWKAIFLFFFSLHKELLCSR